MQKKTAFILVVLMLSFISATAFAAVTVRYYNKDSKSYTFDAKCSGTSTKVSFSASTTSSATIQGSAPCIVQAGNTVTLKGGEQIEIKDGKIIIK